MEDKELIFKRIEEICSEKKVRIKTLCELAGISYGGFRKAKEHGNITISTLKKISDALGVPIVSFFWDESATIVPNSRHTSHLKNENSPGGKNYLVIGGTVPKLEEPIKQYAKPEPEPEPEKYASTYELLRQCQEQNEAFRIAIKNMEKTIELLEEKNKRG